MTNILNELSNNEYWLYNKAGNQLNHIGYTVKLFPDKKHLYDDYKSIHNEYLNVLEDSDDETVKLEALKRLIFLNGYSALEPNYLTGIEELDDKTIFNAYEILNAYIKDGKLDQEFKWMLSYYSSWDFLIFHYSEDKLYELTAFVKSVNTSIRCHPSKELRMKAMNNRGQMGIYWKSLN